MIKPAWGKNIIKEKAKIEEQDRIKAQKRVKKETILYNIDPNILPLNILEKKVELKEGKTQYSETNKQVKNFKKYLKQKELID